MTYIPEPQNGHPTITARCSDHKWTSHNDDDSNDDGTISRSRSLRCACGLSFWSRLFTKARYIFVHVCLSVLELFAFAHRSRATQHHNVTLRIISSFCSAQLTQDVKHFYFDTLCSLSCCRLYRSCFVNQGQEPVAPSHCSHMPYQAAHQLHHPLYCGVARAQVASQ